MLLVADHTIHNQKGVFLLYTQKRIVNASDNSPDPIGIWMKNSLFFLL